MNGILRRDAMKLGLASLIAMNGLKPAFSQTSRKIKKSLKFGMIADKGPDKKPLSIKERLQIAKDAGFAGVEPDTLFDPKVVQEFVIASKDVGIALDAIICSTHWGSPLSSPDEKVAQKTMEGMEISLKNAKDIGADTVLLVPGVVTPQVMYKDAYDRSLARVKELAPIAEKLQVTIAIENVWNKFLLSPIEFRGYIEKVNSPFVKAFFDAGNILLYGFPQDWIRTLKELIVHVDIKDFKLGPKDFVNLLEGDIPWKEVMKALDEIGYEGYMAAEVQGGDLKYLTEKISKPMDKILSL